VIGHGTIKTMSASEREISCSYTVLVPTATPLDVGAGPGVKRRNLTCRTTGSVGDKAQFGWCGGPLFQATMSIAFT
jgi:hypothetical protein